MNTSDVLRAIRASCDICNGTGIDNDEQDCRVCGDPMRAVMRAARGKRVAVAKPAAEATPAPTDDELIRGTNCQAVPDLGGGIRVTWARNDERYALNVGQFGLCVRAGNYICIIHPPIARLVARHIRRLHGE